ncbi:MAG: alpha/beta fold hydrolase [Nitrososphaeraceae archaeon]
MHQSSSISVQNNHKMKIIFSDPTFSLQLLRAIGETYYRGADIGECLSTAYRIKEGDFESWHTEWLKTAKRIHRYADECLEKGHTISARDAYLRASNYYRVSEFMLIDPHDPRIQTTWGNSKECFSKAAKLFPFLVESIAIPCEQGATLPGYFYHNSKESVHNNNTGGSMKSKDTEKKSSRPTIIVHGGFDSTLEELYSSAAAPALERGYNCLTFEGPGQGSVVRKQKIPFRYDWEKVVTPVIDYAINKKQEFGVDVERIALMGMSMGGYLAARAAAFDHRISACILYNGVYDGYDAITSAFPKSLLNALDEGDSKFINSTITALMESDPNTRFNVKHGMWTTGSNSPYDLITGAKNYTLKDIIKNITCPTLVLDAEKDDSFPGQPKKVYDDLRSPKKYILFTQDEGAEEHCQCGAAALSNQRIFDWVDEVFEYKPAPPRE